jgi:hypothetical protein
MLDRPHAARVPRLYCASKSKHAAWWQALRASGMPIVSSWPDCRQITMTASQPVLTQLGHSTPSLTAFQPGRERSNRASVILVAKFRVIPDCFGCPLRAIRPPPVRNHRPYQLHLTMPSERLRSSAIFAFTEPHPTRWPSALRRWRVRLLG